MIGIKYYKQDGNQINMYRLIKEDGNTCSLKPTKGKTVKVTKDELNSDFVKLQIDAILRIAATTAKVGERSVRDVYVLVYKNDNKVPDMAIRQDVMSKSKNFMNNGNPFVGDCCRDEREMNKFIDFDTVDTGVSMALYVDDTIDSIFQIIGKYSGQFNEVLKQIYDERPSKALKGFSLTLKDLFIDNNFMLNYRAIFNIFQVDFVVDRGESCRDPEGNIHLRSSDQKVIEDILCQYIDIGIILKYDKDIDICNIVNKQHCMVSDKYGIIYLITYTIIAPYKPDDDLKEAFEGNKK